MERMTKKTLSPRYWVHLLTLDIAVTARNSTVLNRLHIKPLLYRVLVSERGCSVLLTLALAESDHRKSWFMLPGYMPVSGLETVSTDALVAGERVTMLHSLPDELTGSRGV